ncbi:unnamed protein product [Ambrosiozyma monospora]|uniref:Unnamed protein product n=1 Tax=Ambrosiozyma monospora TaxID=43982 RepID=A0ACB5U4Z4_AMBMO|nr:unnamed protein product [Ambrosiozyma monospora]
MLKLLNPSNKIGLRSILEADYLSQHNLHQSKTISLKVITWNLAQNSTPNLNLFQQLLCTKDNTFPDLFLFNFQETISLRSLSHSDSAIMRWCVMITNTLSNLTDRKYTIVSKSGLLGLTTIILAEASLAEQISEIEVNKIGLGYLGWNNKGCLGTKFRIGNISDDKQPGSEFQLLNIHLVHGEGDETWKDRDASLKKVQDGNKLSAKGVSLYGPAPPDDSQREAWLNVDLQDNELIQIADTKIQLDELFSVHQPKGTTIVCGDTNYHCLLWVH